MLGKLEGRRFPLTLAAATAIALAVAACGTGSSHHGFVPPAGGGTTPSTAAPSSSSRSTGTGTTGSSPIARGPWLQMTTASSTLVLWDAGAPTSQQVRLDSGPLLGSSAATTRHEVQLSGLAASSTHSYTVVDSTGATIAGPFAFRTAPSPGSATTVTVLAFGDSGEGTSDQVALGAQMAGEAEDLILHAGDVVYPSGSIADYEARYFQPYAPMVATRTVFPTLGNHDLDDPQAPGYFDAFVLPRNNPEGSGHYYSFVWGQMKVISLDDWTSFQTTGPPPAMMSWLQGELAASTSRWLVVLLHVPLFSSGAIFSQSEPVKNALAPLFEQFHVDLVIQGHDHAYERTSPIRTTSSPGALPVVYLTTGGAGGVGGLSTLPASLPQTLVRADVAHYVLLTVSTPSIHGRAVGLGGGTVDDFTLSKP